MNNSFGEFLRSKLKERKMTIRNLEKLSGVSNAYISQVMSGARNIPKPAIIKKLAAPLGLSHEELMKAAGYLDEELNINNFPANLILVRGSRSIDEIVLDIVAKTGNPLFNSEFVKSLEEGKIQPSEETINALSEYAHVTAKFWYRENDIESLSKERQLYELDNKIIGRLEKQAIPSVYPSELVKWIQDENNLEYLLLAKKLCDRGVNPAIVEAVIFKK